MVGCYLDDLDYYLDLNDYLDLDDYYLDLNDYLDDVYT